MLSGKHSLHNLSWINSIQGLQTRPNLIICTSTTKRTSDSDPFPVKHECLIHCFTVSHCLLFNTLFYSFTLPSTHLKDIDIFNNFPNYFLFDLSTKFLKRLKYYWKNEVAKFYLVFYKIVPDIR